MALPISPIGQSSNKPAAEAGVVQIDLTAPTGQIVTGAEFGLSTGSQDYNEYAAPNFQAVADQYPVDLLRHNWGGLTPLMNKIFPTRASATSPTFTEIDKYLNQQSNLTSFFNNSTGTQIVTLGFPDWLDISNKSDQTLYANMVKLIAQHFADMGEPINDYELVNEPDQAGYSVTNLAHIFNVVAEELNSVNPNYKLGGLTESFMIPSDLRTFFDIAGPNIGFVSWHQYVTGSSDAETAQQEVTDSMSRVESNASEVRSMMQTANIPASVPLFLGEYNLDYGDYNDPNNGNMVGAVAAAATTYGMIESDTNTTMGALWETANDSAYGVFGSGPNYQVNSVGVVLSNLTKYMPGNIVPTTMPSNTPGLVGYTTMYEGGFSIALIDTNLSHGYTVDLSQDGLPTTGLHRIEVSNTNPTGTENVISDLSSVSVPAGGVVIITNETSHGGTEYPLCFGADTRIATPTGEIPVEKLSVGDPVLTLDGKADRIVWIGTGRVLATRGRRNAATPVIVRKGALGDNVPHSDLHVTKGHSLFIDDVLIPVEFLVNHRSIIWDDRAQEVEIFHVELAQHTVLIANGAPAESYRDDGNRWRFQNANPGWHLPPQYSCAPVVTGGDVVDSVWRRLLDRCGPHRGAPLINDPDLHLLVEGKRIDPIERRTDFFAFRLHGRPRTVRIRSRSSVPQELGVARDARELGVALRRIVLAQPRRQRAIDAGAAALTVGYHAFEPESGIRWTDGDAVVPAELFAGMSGTGMLMLHLGGATQYRDDGKATRAA